MRQSAASMTVESIEIITPADRRRGIASLTLAFVADPVMRWAWPDQDRYLTYWPRIAEAFGGRAFDHGTAHGLGDGLAVALWLPPGVGPDEGTFMELVGASIAPETLRDLTGLFEQMDQLHPTADHWYLPLAGVDPVAQGRGLGSRLLRHGLAIGDRDGLPAYLEATSPRSRDFYHRHGFDITGVIQAGTSPPMWAMFRKPSGGPVTA
jgi:GNAT superfamily N-acetyltransferase